MTLRAAVIGCGRIGSGWADDPLRAGDVVTHADAYSKCPATVLVALCDRDAAAAAQSGARWGAESFADVGTMLNQAAPDIVSICTPNATHFALARQVIDAPSVRAVLCEKPLAGSIKEGETLITRAAARKIPLGVAYVRRHAANMQAVRALISDGGIGDMRAMSGWYGKGTAHNGSHWFDLLRMLVGEVAWVEAADWLGEGGDDPTLDVTLGLRKGAVATLRGTDCRDYTLFEMDLLGSDGRIAIRDGGYSVTLFNSASSPHYSGYIELLPSARDFGDQRDMMLHAVADLADAVLTGREPRCTGADGLAALRIAEAARKAAATATRVMVSP